MGSATIDPHRHKVQTKLYKIPKFSVDLIVSKIQPFENVKIFNGCMAIHFFVITQSKLA